MKAIVNMWLVPPSFSVASMKRAVFCLPLGTDYSDIFYVDTKQTFHAALYYFFLGLTETFLDDMWHTRVDTLLSLLQQT